MTLLAFGAAWTLVVLLPVAAVALAGEYQEYIGHAEVLEPVDLEMLAEPHRFVADGGRVLLARCGEEIVGMVMVELQGEGQCELLKLGVREAYRGRGVGNALMEAALQAARDAGQKRVVLTSNHKLKAALSLYEKFGFEYTTYSDKWFQLSDIRMEREL